MNSRIVDAPELRLLCQLAGIKPTTLAAALNDPERFSQHISDEEFERYLSAASRVKVVIARIQATLDAETARALRMRPELARKLKTKGLLRKNVR